MHYADDVLYIWNLYGFINKCYHPKFNKNKIVWLKNEWKNEQIFIASIENAVGRVKAI